MKKLICVFSLLLCGLFVAIEESDAGSKKKIITPGKTEIKPAPKLVTKIPIVSIEPKVKTTTGTKTEMLKQVQGASANWNMNAWQPAAVDKLVSQQPLNDNDRQQLSNLLFDGPQAGLSKEDERVLGELLLDETGRETVSTTSPGNEPAPEKTGPWFLRVYNNTGEKLKVFVQVVPDVEPKKDDKAAAKKPATSMYDLETGKAYDLQQAGQRVKASSIHVWAMSPTRHWVEHREQELRLTTPPNQSKTYILTFAK